MKNIKNYISLGIITIISIAVFIGCSKNNSQAAKPTETTTTKSVEAADATVETENTPVATTPDGDIEGVAWDEPKERPDIAEALMDKVNAYREQNGIRVYESPYTYYDVANPEYGDSLSDKGDRVCKHIILNWGEMIEDGQMSTGDIGTLDDNRSSETIAEAMFQNWYVAPVHNLNMLDDGAQYDTVDVAVMHVYEYWDGKWRYYQAVMTRSSVPLSTLPDGLD